jgi:Domain of unknown function (DUF1330)
VPKDSLQKWPVSRRVNSSRASDDDPTLIEEIAMAQHLEALMTGPVYALNLVNVADRAEYLAYSRRSSKEVEAHGGRVVALGKFCEAAAGDIKPPM